VLSFFRHGFFRDQFGRRDCGLWSSRSRKRRARSLCQRNRHWRALAKKSHSENGPATADRRGERDRESGKPERERGKSGEQISVLPTIFGRQQHVLCSRDTHTSGGEKRGRWVVKGRGLGSDNKCGERGVRENQELHLPAINNNGSCNNLCPGPKA